MKLNLKVKLKSSFSCETILELEARVVNEGNNAVEIYRRAIELYLQSNDLNDGQISHLSCVYLKQFGAYG